MVKSVELANQVQSFIASRCQPLYTMYLLLNMEAESILVHSFLDARLLLPIEGPCACKKAKSAHTMCKGHIACQVF